MSNKDEPSVIIAGGGPVGLLAAILFAEIGVKTAVIERASEPDEWSTKSFSMVIGPCGQSCLSRGKCLDTAKEVGLPRKYIYFVDGKTGDKKSIPKQMPGLGFSRPLLVDCIEKNAKKSSLITIKRGSGVSNVVTKPDGEVQVHLEDGSIESASHVVGADGKWSKVRQSYESLNSQAEIESCVSFGVHMMAPIPEGWETEGTYVIKPSPECMFYIIAAPIQSGELSLSMVCYDDTVKKYPFLAPPEDLDPSQYSGSWEDEYSALPEAKIENPQMYNDLASKLEELFEKELPNFAAAIGKSAFKTARINRHVSWLKPTLDTADVNYSTEDGLVCLVGDAGHAVTPSLGEGCNTGMESSVKLIDAILAQMKDQESDVCTKEILSAGFASYGKSRPAETIPIQIKSAAASNMKRS